MPQSEDHEGHWDYLRIYGPAVLLAVVALAFAWQFVNPAPPDKITMATGGNQGAYFAFAHRYREILARDGVTLEVLETAGSLANIELLDGGDSRVDVAFVQGGTGRFARGDKLVSLASVYYEPVWIFVRGGLDLSSYSDIKDQRVSIGPEGSGTRVVALQMLEAIGIPESHVGISKLNGERAARALMAGELDMMILVASPESPLVARVLAAPDISVANFSRGDAYIRRHRYMSKLILPEGAIDLARNLPPEDVILLAPTANLVATRDLHPALVDLLLAAAVEVHREGGIFEEPGAFPSPRYVEFPLSEDARRFFESGTPFLRRVLPYWAATLVDRLLVMLLPLVAIILPLMRIMPPVWRWSMRKRVYRWYKELRTLERQVREGIPEEEMRRYLSELGRIDDDVKKVTIPWSYAEELYHLRLHIKYVREELLAVWPKNDVTMD
jgi:TRAP transporter TAXI family solute receptor